MVGSALMMCRWREHGLEMPTGGIFQVTYKQ